MKVWLACDPGVSGAIAVFKNEALSSIVDMEASEGLVLTRSLRHLFVAADMLVIEHVAAMGKNGSIGNFKLGHNYGVIIGAAEHAELVVYRYRPSEWKKAMGLAGKDKAASRRLAGDLHPEAADYFKRARDDGRAEAVLIGDYHLRKYGWER